MKDEARKQLAFGYDCKFDESEWETYSNPIELTPQQPNGFDCGVYTTMFADFITDDLPLQFDQKSAVNLFRRKICAAVLRGTIDYPLPVNWKSDDQFPSTLRDNRKGIIDLVSPTSLSAETKAGVRDNNSDLIDLVSPSSSSSEVVDQFLDLLPPSSDVYKDVRNQLSESLGAETLDATKLNYIFSRKLNKRSFDYITSNHNALVGEIFSEYFDDEISLGSVMSSARSSS